MKAYLIGQVNIIDTGAYEDYKKSTAPLVKKYGGKFIIRGGNYEVVHGKWDYKRNVVIEFPNIEDLKNWYYSKEYAEVRKIREENSDGNVIIIEGV